MFPIGARNFSSSTKIVIECFLPLATNRASDFLIFLRPLVSGACKLHTSRVRNEISRVAFANEAATNLRSNPKENNSSEPLRHARYSRKPQQTSATRAQMLSATEKRRADGHYRSERRQQILAESRARRSDAVRTTNSTKQDADFVSRLGQAMRENQHNEVHNVLMSARQCGALVPLSKLHRVENYYAHHGLVDFYKTSKIVSKEMWPEAYRDYDYAPNEARCHWMRGNQESEALNLLTNYIDCQNTFPDHKLFTQTVARCAYHSINSFVENRKVSQHELELLCRLATRCYERYQMKGPLLRLFGELFYAPFDELQKLAYSLLDAHADVLKVPKIMCEDSSKGRGIVLKLIERAKENVDAFALTRIIMLIEELKFESAEAKRPLLEDLYNTSINMFCDNNDMSNARKVFDMSQKVLENPVDRFIIRPETVKRLQAR